MATHENRLVEIEANVNQLKGAYEHFATKADVTRLETDLAQLESRLTRWIAGGVFLILVGLAVQEILG